MEPAPDPSQGPPRAEGPPRSGPPPSAPLPLGAGLPTPAEVHARVAGPPRPPAPPARRSRLAVAAFVLGLAGPLACGVGQFLALPLGAIAESRIRRSKGTLRGRGWLRFAVLFSFAWIALFWEGRDRIVSLVLTRISNWEELPPLDPARAEELERALDRLSRFDLRSRVEGRVRLVQGGEAAVPHLINRMGILQGLGSLRLDRRVRSLVDSRERIREVLVELTVRDFGLDAPAWRRWWLSAKDGSRDDWALDALLSADDESKRRGLEHFSGRRERDPRVLAACLAIVREGEPPLRGEAYALLVGCADRDFGFDPSASTVSQPDAVAAIERWVREASAAGGVLIPWER